MNRVLSIAIIGAGRMGALHGTNFAKRVPGAAVRMVVDSNRAMAEKLAAELGASASDRFEDALGSPEIDAIVISTPVFTHKEFCIKAAAAGKHIFCEKPLTLNSSDADEIVAAVKASGVKFLMAYMTRFDRSFEAGKARLEQQVVGNPVFVRSTGRDPGLPPVPGWGSDPEACGDISFELCSHDYDRLRWLLRDEVKQVYARAGILSSQEIAKQCGGKMINDTLVVMLEFTRGALASVDGLLNIKYGYDARVEVVGDQGLLSIGDVKYVDVGVAGPGKAYAAAVAPSFIDRFHEAYIKEAQHFVDCILLDRPCRVTVDDGAAAVRIAHAVNQSIRTGQPITLR